MKVLVTGVCGQLGHDVVQELNRRHISCQGVDVADFDITQADQTEKYVKDYAPTALIHCAAYTAVDRAEEDATVCEAVNAKGSENLAKVCGELGCKMVYISTDYVFGGAGDAPFEADAPKNPCNVYGKTKLAGEEAVLSFCPKHFIVRTSWVFGKNGNNFVKTMLRLGAQNPVIRVVSDQIGSPTYTKDLAVLLCDMIETEKYGVYHAANEGFCSWADFTQKIMEFAGLPAKVEPIPTSAYPTKAKRPLNSRLSRRNLDEAGFHRLPTWQDALQRYLEELKTV